MVSGLFSIELYFLFTEPWDLQETEDAVLH